MICESIPQRVEAVQFDGSAITAITAITGDGNISFEGGHLQVRVSGGRWEDVLPGWWVISYEDDGIGVASGAAFARYWKKADGSHAGAE